jgi:hypothetical protein
MHTPDPHETIKVVPPYQPSKTRDDPPSSPATSKDPAPIDPDAFVPTSTPADTSFGPDSHAPYIESFVDT